MPMCFSVRARRVSPRLLAATAAVAAALSAAHAPAAIYTWTGGGGGPNWDSSSVLNAGFFRIYYSNWGSSNISPIIPVSSPATSLIFANSSAGTSNQDLASPFQLNSLSFTGPSMTLSGNALAFVANGATNPTLTSSATDPQTISNNLLLGANLGVSAAGNLYLDGQITGPSAGITTSASGKVVLTGGTNSAPSTLSFLHIASGSAMLAGGNLQTSSLGSTGFNGESSLFVEGNSTLIVQGGTQLSTAGTPQIHNNGLMAVQGAGTTWVNNGSPGSAEIRVGYAGSGSILHVTAGASVLTNGDMRIGNTSFTQNPGVGRVEVIAGSELGIAGRLRIDEGSVLDVGQSTGTIGSLESVGTSVPVIDISDWNSSPALTVGGDGTSSTFAGVIQNGAFGSGSLVKTGTGTLTLSGHSSYNGLTTINNGTLQLGVDDALYGTGNVHLAGGTFDLNGHAQTLGGISILPSGKPILITGGTLNVHTGIYARAQAPTTDVPLVETPVNYLQLGGGFFIDGALVDHSSPSSPFADLAMLAPMSGQSPIFYGTGRLLVAAPATYTGTTTVNGPVYLGVASALPSSSDVTVNSGGILGLALPKAETYGAVSLPAGGTDQAVGSIAGAGNIELGHATLTVGSSNASTTFSGVIADGPNGAGGSLVKTGSGWMTLSGANTYTGGTRIDQGALSISADSNLGAASAPLTLNGGGMVVTTSFSSARPIAVTADNWLSTDVNSLTLTGALSGSAALWKYGSGSLTFSGTGTMGSLSLGGNSGSVVLDNGSLTLTATGTTGWGSNSSVFVERGSTLTVRNGFHLTSYATPQFHNSSTVLVDGPSTVWSNLTPTGGNYSEIRLGYAGSTSSMTVQNGATVSTPNFRVGDYEYTPNPGIATLAITSGAKVNVASNLIVDAGSSITVNHATLTAGILTDYWSGQNGNPVATISLTDPAGSSALILAPAGNFASTYAYSVVQDGPNGPGGITYSPSAQYTSQALYNATYSGPTTITSGSFYLTNGRHNGSFAVHAGALVLSGGTASLGSNSISVDPGAVALYQDGLVLTGGFLRGSGGQQLASYSSFPSTTLSATTLLPGVNLVEFGNSTSTFLNVTSSAAITSNNSLKWDGGIQTAAGSLAVNGTVATDYFENDGTITVKGKLINSLSNLVSGGGSSITVNPGGTVSLNNTALDLHSALLVNNGTIAGGHTHVGFGSLAKGSGTYAALDLLSGGTFSPGNSPGSVTTGDTTWNGGATYLFELAHATGVAGTDWDLWHVNGNLTLAASAVNPFIIDISPLNLSGFNPASNFQWQLADVTGTVSGFDPADILLRPEGVCACDGTFSISQPTPGSIVLTYTSVPEPASLGLLAVALPLLSRRRRKA